MKCHAAACQRPTIPGLPMCSHHLSLFPKATQERLTAR